MPSNEQTQKALDNLFGLADKLGHWYGHWHFASALVKGRDAWKHAVTHLYPLMKGSEATLPLVWDYGLLRMSRGSITFEEVRTFVAHLCGESVFNLPDLPRIPLSASLHPDDPLHKLGSSSTAHISLGYANTSFRFSLDSNYENRIPSVRLYSYDLPFYSEAAKAVADFFGLPTSATHGLNPELVVFLPDYRARIRNVTLSATRAKVECELNNIAAPEIVGKYSYEGRSGLRNGDFIVGREPSEISMPEFPDRLVLTLISADGEMVDVVEYSPASIFANGRFELEVAPATLDQMVLTGESDVLEFKRDLPKSRDEIAISAVAMANRKGGQILIGVDDSSNIVGCTLEKPEETIRNILRNYCDPPLEPRVQTIDHKGMTVIAINVSEGSDKPYGVKGRGFYLRSGSTDRLITRYELDQIYRPKNSLGFLIPHWTR